MKKRFLLLLSLFLISTSQFAQVSTDSNGSIKFRGNVAVFVNGRFFTFNDGIYTQRVDDEATNALTSSLEALVMQKFNETAYGVVNRDNVAYARVKQLLEENKLEDYLNGISVQAKNQGADFLYFVDLILYGENDKAFQYFISTRLLNVENNMGYHYTYKSKPIPLTSDVEAMRQDVSKMVKYISSDLSSQLLSLFPEQYGIDNAKGKDLYLLAYQTTGKILNSDKFNVYNYMADTIKIKDIEQPIIVLEPITVADNPRMKGSSLVVTAKKTVEPSPSVVLLRNEFPKYAGNFNVTFFGLKCDMNTKEGFYKHLINNAVYSALTKHPGTNIIEQEHLSELKKERELQKTEDFLDGHVVEQMKAIGADYLLHISNYKSDGAKVSFTIDFIEVEENRIWNTVNVESSIDNIDNEMYKQICQRFGTPCSAKELDKKSIEIKAPWSIPQGTKCVLEFVKPITNPTNGEVSYQRVDLCEIEVAENQAYKSICKIIKILDKDDFVSLDEKSINGQITISIDDSMIKSDVSTVSEVEKEAKKQNRKEKANKVLRFIGNVIGDSMQPIN